MNVLRQNASLQENPQKSVLICIQILNPVKHTDILAPDLVGGQSEMMQMQMQI